MSKKRLITVIVCVLAVWIVIGALDFAMVSGFNKPIFCIGIRLSDNGGSGTYIGLGYAFDIRGDFTPEANPRGVTSYVGYIFGIEAASGTRG